MSERAMHGLTEKHENTEMKDVSHTLRSMSYSNPTNILLLCFVHVVFSLSFQRSGWGLNHHRPAGRQIEWGCLWGFCGLFPCFDLHSFFFFNFRFRKLVSQSHFLPCHPTVLLPPSHLRHRRTTHLMIWWDINITVPKHKKTFCVITSVGKTKELELFSFILLDQTEWNFDS